jgi:hypothetical protein
MGYTSNGLMDLDNEHLVMQIVKALTEHHIRKFGVRPYRFKASWDYIILFDPDETQTKYPLHECGFKFNRLGQVSHFNPSALE